MFVMMVIRIAKKISDTLYCYLSLFPFSSDVMMDVIPAIAIIYIMCLYDTMNMILETVKIVHFCSSFCNFFSIKHLFGCAWPWQRNPCSECPF